MFSCSVFYSSFNLFCFNFSFLFAFILILFFTTFHAVLTFLIRYFIPRRRLTNFSRRRQWWCITNNVVQTMSCSLKTCVSCSAPSTCCSWTLHWSAVNCQSAVKSLMTWSSLLVSCWPLTLTNWPLRSVSESSSDRRDSSSPDSIYKH